MRRCFGKDGGHTDPAQMAEWALLIQHVRRYFGVSRFCGINRIKLPKVF